MLAHQSLPLAKGEGALQIKTRTTFTSTMVRAFYPPRCFSLSADKHLLVSVAAVNWTRRGRHQHFQAASQARQNRGQLASRFNDFSLYELGGHCHSIMCGVDRAAHQLNF